MGNATPDARINALSIRGQWVVVTKDTDFYHSHLLNGRPWKLVLVRVGNMRLKDLLHLFATHWPEIEHAIQASSLIELDVPGVEIVR